jgi:hypothetical protein
VPVEVSEEHALHERGGVEGDQLSRPAEEGQATLQFRKQTIESGIPCSALAVDEAVHLALRQRGCEQDAMVALCQLREQPIGWGEVIAKLSRTPRVAPAEEGVLTSGSAVVLPSCRRGSSAVSSVWSRVPLPEMISGLVVGGRSIKGISRPGL